MSAHLNPQTVTRMSGAGNTFFIVNQMREITIQAQHRAELARKWCSETHTDGCLFLENFSGLDFLWDFYNADGSSAEMCGNAARCVALYHFEKIEPKADIRWLTKAGPVAARVIDPETQLVQVYMPKPRDIRNPMVVKNIRGYFINTGVPHFVLHTAPDQKLASELRSAPEFGSSGANITFVEMDDSDFVQAVTYERGVEGFTLACGTGAVAAAKLHHELHPEILIQNVEMPGGTLQIEWQDGNPLLTGTAEFHFDARFYEEFT